MACRFPALVLVSLAVAATAVPVRAQARIDVGAAYGVMHPLHGDFDFVAPAWQASVRFHRSPRVLVEIGVTQGGTPPPFTRTSRLRRSGWTAPPARSASRNDHATP